MTAPELLNLLLGNPTGFLEFLAERSNETREIFNNISRDSSTEHTLKQLVVGLSEFDDTYRQNQGFQVLLTHLALYFQGRRLFPFVSFCFVNLNGGSRYYNRLKAWLHKEQYNNYISHISELPYYLRLLNADALKGDEDATYDLVSDLIAYVNDVEHHLPAPWPKQLKDAITTEANQNEFLVVKAYVESLEREISGLTVQAYTNKEYVPSRQMQQVFEDGFMREVRERSPDFPKRPLGYDSQEVRYNIIKCGQADFDAGYENLLPLDVVMLYCYFNMRKHFFTSLSVFERTNIVEQFCNDLHAPLKFIDIGCGPGTAGLALLDCIYSKGYPPFPIDYYGIDISAAMQNMAKVLLNNPLWNNEGRLAFLDSLKELKTEEIGGRGCILISASYVFASDSLDPGEIASLITSLKTTYPRTSILFFFQNSIKAERNRNYVQFKKNLVNSSEIFQGKETILYHMKSGQFYNVKSEPVYYEVLKF